MIFLVTGRNPRWLGSPPCLALRDRELCLCAPWLFCSMFAVNEGFLVFCLSQYLSMPFLAVILAFKFGLTLLDLGFISDPLEICQLH